MPSFSYHLTFCLLIVAKHFSAKPPFPPQTFWGWICFHQECFMKLVKYLLLYPWDTLKLISLNLPWHLTSLTTPLFKGPLLLLPYHHTSVFSSHLSGPPLVFFFFLDPFSVFSLMWCLLRFSSSHYFLYVHYSLLSNLNHSHNFNNLLICRWLSNRFFQSISLLNYQSIR